MLMSIDRVLQLLSEGKNIEKIAELSDADVEDVCEVIKSARRLLAEHDRARAKKKIVIKKRHDEKDSDNALDHLQGVDIRREDIIMGAELSAMPMGSSLIIFIDGASSGNPGPAGIGVVINDEEGRQVGKVSSYIGYETNNIAEYTALIRALKIAVYFKTKVLKIRTDSELVVKQVKGEYRVTNEKIKHKYDQVMKLKRMVNSCTIEHVTRNFNDKADYLAKKAVSDYREGEK